MAFVWLYGAFYPNSNRLRIKLAYSTTHAADHCIPTITSQITVSSRPPYKSEAKITQQVYNISATKEGWNPVERRGADHCAKEITTTRRSLGVARVMLNCSATLLSLLHV